MDFFKKFDNWNTRNKDMSVTAEQYTIIKTILEQADFMFEEQEKKISGYNFKMQEYELRLSNKEQIIKDLQHYLIILSLGLIAITITYGSIIYLSVQ